MISLEFIQAAASPTGFRWYWLVLAPGATAVLGFLAGWLFARYSLRWRMKRAAGQADRLVACVTETLAAAQRTCLALEQTTGLLLDSGQTEQLQQYHGELTGSLSRILQQQGELAEQARAEAAELERRKSEFAIDWQRDVEAEAASGGMPDRDAFEQNFELLLNAGRDSGVQSGLLLVRIDRLADLTRRFGEEAADTFVQRVSQVVLRAVRDDDLLCRYSRDTLAVLLPGIETARGVELARAVRDSVRHHHFRLEADAPEVYVTASLGFTPCLPVDNPDLTLNRAGDALAQSVRSGRNQLHMHDGRRLTACSA